MRRRRDIIVAMSTDIDIRHVRQRRFAAHCACADENTRAIRGTDLRGQSINRTTTCRRHDYR